MKTELDPRPWVVTSPARHSGRYALLAMIPPVITTIRLDPRPEYEQSPEAYA